MSDWFGYGQTAPPLVYPGATNATSALQNLSKVYIYSVQNAHFKTTANFQTLIESIVSKDNSKFQIELVIIQEQSDLTHMVSTQVALELAHMLRCISRHTTIETDTGIGPIMLAYLVGKANMFIRPKDYIVVLYDTDCESTIGTTISFLKGRAFRHADTHDTLQPICVDVGRLNLGENSAASQSSNTDSGATRYVESIKHINLQR